MKLEKWMMLLGILGIISTAGFSPTVQAKKSLEEIWSYTTDTTFSISVSEDGNLAFSEGTKEAGYIHIYNREDDSLQTWKCSSTERVIVSGPYVLAIYNGDVFSLFQIKPSEQLWGKRIDSLSSLSLDYSYEAKRGVIGDIPMDPEGNLAASTIWMFDQNGDVVWQKRLNVALTCAIVNKQGYVVAAGEKFGPYDEDFNYTKGENVVYVFNPSGNVLANVQFDSPPIDVGIDKGAEKIVVGKDNGGMALLNKDGHILWEKDNIGGYVAIDEQGKKVATTKSYHLVLLDQKGKTLWESQQEGVGIGGIEGLSISPKGEYVGISTFDNEVVIFDALSEKVIYQTNPGKKVSRVSLSNFYAGMAIEGEVKLLSLK